MDVDLLWCALIRASTLPHQVGRKVDEVRIVLVDELHHSALERPKVGLQVLAKVLDRHALAAMADELVHVEVFVQKHVRREAELLRVGWQRHGVPRCFSQFTTG